MTAPSPPPSRLDSALAELTAAWLRHDGCRGDPERIGDLHRARIDLDEARDAMARVRAARRR